MERLSDKCIVSFSSFGRENYNKAQLRLVHSCARIPWDGDYIIRSLDGYCDEYSGIPIKLGSYPSTSTNNHAEIPYGFKPDIVMEAYNAGYKQVIWCDSTICMVKYPVKTLEFAREHGVACFNNEGHPLWAYVSDNALNQQKLTAAHLAGMPQIMACVMAFDFTNDKGKEIFLKWFEASRDGISFQNYTSDRKGFKAHRHDQAVMSMLLFKNHIPMLPYGWLVYQPHDDGYNDVKPEWINKGVDQPL